MAATTDGNLTDDWTLIANAEADNTIVVFSPLSGKALVRIEVTGTLPTSKRGHPFDADSSHTFRLKDGERLYARTFEDTPDGAPGYASTIEG